ncbi:hypothetical protein [Geodermatophilus sabuli]|uniref:hypothetical protein n=1 Tax=Geodermatophilus sabuli TaxID=1564158 RepID=UPI001559C856|nr:hypothetical protein [Geodermatophilus sabuli]MBB3084702.1 hypothetical protein [Geodermatophilus sabuli]
MQIAYFDIWLCDSSNTARPGDHQRAFVVLTTAASVDLVEQVNTDGNSRRPGAPHLRR